MEKLCRDVILLMKSAITGEACPLPEDFDLEQVCQVLKKHNIQALGYVGAKNCGVDRQASGMQQLLISYRQSVFFSERQMAAIRKVYQALDAAELDYMPVKGCNMKTRYPYPEMRMMGDADILIRTGQYDRIRRVMQELGFTEGEEVDHVIVWESQSLCAELHKRLIPSDNEDFFRYYGDGWQLAARREGTHFYMKPEDEFIYIFTHMAKHYRYGGIGFRQVLDLWVLLRTYPEMDGDYISGEMRKLRLLEFYRNIRRTLQVWFEDLEPDAVTDLISDYIFNSGCWGTMAEYDISQVVSRMDGNGRKNMGRLTWALKTVFPDTETLGASYPIARRYPGLKPAVWVWRWVDILITRPQNVTRKIHSAKAMTDENLTDFQKSLHAVGLDFRFDEET